MKKVAKLLVVILIMVMAFSVAGCAKKPADNNSAANGQKDAAKTILNVGTEATYPPFEYMENNEYVGFDMDLIRAIAEAEGMEVKITPLGFDALIPAVQAGTVDCIISAMTIKEDRAKVVDFSTPYFKAGLIVAVAQNNTDIKGLDDLKGKRLAAEVGTTGLNASNGVKAKDAKTTVKVFDSVGEAFMELEKGGVDAVINDMPVTTYYIETTGKDKVKKVGSVFQAEDQYGIGVKKGNTELLNKINEGLAKLQENGKYDEIYKKWFGEQK
ncbi:MAG: basic amino acid ABC transporter substrate-binding protein [Syntrophomonadaceae bacterium]|nr:basic amino acid ABC transporter substrate-binding protein [Syntrophomonadaceae bacterium]